MSGSRDRSRRSALGLISILLTGMAGLWRPSKAQASPEPWTVDRWAGRPRRVARARPDRPLPKRGRSPDASSEALRRWPASEPLTRVTQSSPNFDPVSSIQRARGGLVEQVHADPLPELPAVEHFEGRGSEINNSTDKASSNKGMVQPDAIRRRKGSGGQGMVELLIAAPVVLFAGLVLLQLVLLMQARQALRLGALEAARSASVAHADPSAALQGLARGLAPWWVGAEQTQDALTAPVRTQVHLAQALALGQLRITQLAPDESAFADWAVPAIDPNGQPLAGQREIPNDALRVRSTETLPHSARPVASNGQPVGSRSGQTLLQANILRLQIDYAVPLRVPIAGQAIALLARSWQTEPQLRRMSSAKAVPIRVSVAVRMQTPARYGGTVSG